MQGGAGFLAGLVVGFIVWKPRRIPRIVDGRRLGIVPIAVERYLAVGKDLPKHLELTPIQRRRWFQKNRAAIIGIADQFGVTIKHVHKILSGWAVSRHISEALDAALEQRPVPDGNWMHLRLNAAERSAWVKDNQKLIRELSQRLNVQPKYLLCVFRGEMESDRVSEAIDSELFAIPGRQYKE